MSLVSKSLGKLQERSNVFAFKFGFMLNEQFWYANNLKTYEKIINASWMFLKNIHVISW